MVTMQSLEKIELPAWKGGFITIEIDSSSKGITAGDFIKGTIFVS
jgi:hypothetical protein